MSLTTLFETAHCSNRPIKLFHYIISFFFNKQYAFHVNFESCLHLCFIKNIFFSVSLKWIKSSKVSEMLLNNAVCFTFRKWHLQINTDLHQWRTESKPNDCVVGGDHTPWVGCPAVPYTYLGSVVQLSSQWVEYDPMHHTHLIIFLCHNFNHF